MQSNKNPESGLRNILKGWIIFFRERIGDVEQRRRFLARLKLELKRVCVVKTYIDIEEMVIATIEIERVL
jgi:hypothetical protein